MRWASPTRFATIFLDIEGSTEDIGKQQGADLLHDKATYPALFGMPAARERARALLDTALDNLNALPGPADGLHWLAHLIVERSA